LIVPPDWADNLLRLEQPAFKQHGHYTLKNIFVGNLDFGATEESIRSLFEPHGAVERVKLVTDRDTGRSRGFAFVEMTDSSEADRAIEALNGEEVGGRALNVNEARPKTNGGGPRARRESRW
jgi:RNA recognition motif-containing protein